ncbi:MAG: EamA family transporter [Saprospiraceae bacterium]|nr:EamA family transporter [Saprospiraceae bacterium]
MAQKNQRSQFLFGFLILIIANIGFSSKAVVIKLLYREGVDTLSVIAMRMIFSLPIFVFTAIVLYTKKDKDKTEAPLTWQSFLLIGALGVLSYYVSSMLDFLGLQYVTASVERLILFTYPTIVLIISIFFYGKKIAPPQSYYIIFSLLLTYLGIFIAFAAENGIGQQTDLVKGSLLIGACAFTYALYVVWTGELVHRVGSVRFTAYAMIGATVPAIIQSYIYNGVAIFGYSAEVYKLAIWLVLGATIIPVFLITEGIRLVGASLSSIIGFVGPVATIILGRVFLSEIVTPLQLLGTGFVLFGIFFIGWKGKNKI